MRARRDATDGTGNDLTISELKQQARGEAGERMVGTMVRLVRNPAIALVAKNGGLDFIMVDMEHSTHSFETLADIMRTARLAGIEGFVRVPELSKAFVSRALDAGATGVMVPMIETVAQAEALVQWGKFAPAGGRGFGSVGDHTGFTGAKATEYMPQANEETLLIAQIESRQGAESIEQIAAVDGIDACLIGPNDLANSLGIPGDLFHERNLEAIMRIATAVRASGKVLGLHGPDRLTEMLLDEGLTLIMSSHDTGLLTEALRGVADRYRARR